MGSRFKQWIERLFTAWTGYHLLHDQALSELRGTITSLREEPTSLGGSSRAGALFAHSMPRGFPEVQLADSMAEGRDTDLAT